MRTHTTWTVESELRSTLADIRAAIDAGTADLTSVRIAIATALGYEQPAEREAGNGL